jgi:hypothetical protein
MQSWVTVITKSAYPASALQSQTKDDKTTSQQYANIIKESNISALSWKELSQKLRLHVEKKNWEKEWNVFIFIFIILFILLTSLLFNFIFKKKRHLKFMKEKNFLLFLTMEQKKITN